MNKEARKLSKRGDGPPSRKTHSNIPLAKYGLPPEQHLYGKDSPLDEPVILTEKIEPTNDAATTDVFAEFEKSTKSDLPELPALWKDPQPAKRKTFADKGFTYSDKEWQSLWDLLPKRM